MNKCMKEWVINARMDHNCCMLAQVLKIQHVNNNKLMCRD